MLIWVQDVPLQIDTLQFLKLKRRYIKAMFLVVCRSDVYFDFEVHFLCARSSAQVKLLL